MTKNKKSTFRALLRVAVFIASSVVCTPSFAYLWGVQTTITGYYVYTEGDAFFKTASNQNPDNCASAAYLALPGNTPKFAAVYATIIAAQAAGSTVSVCYDGCYGQYPRIISVAVPNVW